MRRARAVSTRCAPSPGDAEKGVAAALDIDESTSGKQKKADANRDELSELLEGAKSADSLKPTDLRVACDRVELTLLRAALDNKVTDTELLTAVVEAAGPFMDASFAPLGVQMAQSDLDVLRHVGYRVLGLAKNKAPRALVEKGLREARQRLLRRQPRPTLRYRVAGLHHLPHADQTVASGVGEGAASANPIAGGGLS